MVFSDVLRRLRLNEKYTQKVCAEKLGVELANYNKWENGVAPNFEMLVKIADFFDVSIDYLLGRSPYKSYQEWRDLDEPNHLEDEKNASYFGLGIYRDFKEYSNIVGKANKYYGRTLFDEWELLNVLFMCVVKTISAYKEAFETIAESNHVGQPTHIGELIEKFLKDIRAADNSGEYINTLFRELTSGITHGNL
ncbi:MAG: helix-turn-helix transcriptional regulator [Defluviitaleaceae bacterium]|nr:helix-turn-helix transcriptional regulator [Defluviitaleaceae bacterium]